MEIFKITQESLFVIEDWQKDSNLVAGITNRLGGVSHYPKDSLNMAFHVNDEVEKVVANRQIVSKKILFPLTQWVGAKQTHETNIHTVTCSEIGRGSVNYESSLEATDGLFTMEKDILLTLCFADCVPVFFKSKDNKAIGIAHAGWKSTVGLIAPKMIEVFEKIGIEKNDIEIVIGPSICKECYTVNSSLINHVQNILDTNIIKPYEEIGENQYLLDLKLLNKLLLQNIGIASEQIKTTEYCTSCSNELFFSHRREKGHTGRIMSYIGMRG